MIWMDIPGFPGYKASLDGQIMSVKREEPRILEPWPNHKGYLEVCLSVEGQRQNMRIHQLMALTYHGPCPQGLEVCHNDGNQTNNRAGNLRYDTHQANVLDAINHGTHNPSIAEVAAAEAARTSCDQGHEYTPENTMWRYGKGGKAGRIKYRKCRECHRIAIAKQRAKDPEKTRRQGAKYAREWRARKSIATD